MIKNTVSVRAPGVPWGALLREAVRFLKEADLALYGFLLSFFFISLLGQLFDDFEWSNLNPVQLWTSVSVALLNFAISYFAFVTFTLWVRSTLPGFSKLPFSQIMKNSSALMIPLTILSLRGAILSLFGLFLFILPGLYFCFKYELASLCLILEGWQEEAPPLIRSERMIKHYKFELLFLALLMVIESMIPWLLEQSTKLGGLQIGWAFRIFVAFMDSSISVGATVYVTLVVLFLMKNNPISSQAVETGK